MATSDAKRRDNRRGRTLDAAAVEFARAGYSAAHVETLHRSKDYGSVIATEFPRRHSPTLRARMIEDLPLPPGTSRTYFRLAEDTG